MLTGLAIEESDLDITIQGLIISDRGYLLALLQALSYSLETQSFVEDCKLIVTARVPVIKLVRVLLMGIDYKLFKGSS